MRFCKHHVTSWRCSHLAGVWIALFVVMSLLSSMTASYAQFVLGNARVTSVIGLTGDTNNPACVFQETLPTGTEYWNVRQDHTYRVRLEGVSECSGDTIQVYIFNPFRDVNDPEDCYAPQCVTASRVGNGIYEFEVAFDNTASKTYFIRYCTSSDCSAGGFIARRSDGGNSPAVIRLAHFDPRDCRFIREDKTCFPKGCPTIDKLELDCNPESIPSCEELYSRLYSNCEDCQILEVLACRNGEDEPDPERGNCWKKRRIEFDVIDCEFRFYTVVGYINWQEDEIPPTLNNVPEGEINLGCNPSQDQLPQDCQWLIDQFGIEAKDNCVKTNPEGHEPPTLHCEEGPIEELSKCRFRKTFTLWATDKCGNRSRDYVVTYIWKVDTEPPTVNNVPELVDLGCNPEELPSCDWLIARYGIEAKDNCTEEGNAPILYCEAGPVEELSKCRYRQVFRFWAVDKSECGNRSQDYFATVEWQIDYEPPVINNLPRGGKLPCNTRPTCEYLIQRYNIEAKDNCDKEPQLYCEPGEREQIEGCQYRQTFRFWAVDKCGNRTQDYFVTFFWKEDTEPPVLHNLPSGGDLGCNPTQIPTCADFQVTATDNCTQNVQVSCFSNDLLLGCLYIRVFTFSAADECGNVASATVTYYWTVDNTPPIVRCPEDIVVQAQPKECFVQVTWRAKADDDCDPSPSLSCDPPSGSLFPLGTTLVTCTARDRCGNTATCTFRVTVLGFVCGTKFHDRNGNGVRDPGEEGLAGWTIELVDAATGVVLQTAVTDEDGRYCFLGLASPGTYIVREVLQPGWTNTTPRERLYVLPRDCGKQVDFGNRRTQ